MIRRFTVLLFLAATTVGAQQQWSVAIAGGDANDPRVAAVQEAVSYWNRTLADLHVPVRFGPVFRNGVADVDESILQRVSNGNINGTAAYRALDMSAYRADVVVFLSDSEIISSGTPREHGNRGYVILRSGEMPPLSLPNVARNVAAHELGHVLGLEHNADPDYLMCGRPAPCRPYAFQQDEARVFPLTVAEKESLQKRFSRATSRASSERRRGSSRRSIASRRPSGSSTSQ